MKVAIIGAGNVGKALATSITRAGHDVTNPLKPDYSGLATEGSSAAEEFQKRLPNSNVVKAFNTIFASNQAAPTLDIDGYVAGDDAKAKQQVISLVESMGFAPVDVGALSASRHLEGMAFINIGLNAANGWSWTSAWRLER